MAFQPLDPALTQNLLTTFGFTSLTLEEQERALKSIGDIVFQKVMLKVVEVLQPKDLEQFNIVLQAEDQNPGSTLQFLKSHISDFDALVTAEVAEFKQDASDVMDAARRQAEL